MLVLPHSAAELAGGAVVAESSWTGLPTGSSLQSEARVAQRLQAAETITRQAEAAAQAAGLVAQSVMGELILAREEAAVALRFIRGAWRARAGGARRASPGRCLRQPLLPRFPLSAPPRYFSRASRSRASLLPSSLSPARSRTTISIVR